MKAQTKQRITAFIDRVDAALWLIVRRWTIRQLRKLVDVADDRLHATEVALREEITARTVRTEPLIDNGAFVEGSASAPYDTPTSYAKWEARRSGVAPISKKAARQRREKTRMTAAAFDLKYAR
jgi:hypothetical protein